MVNLSKYQDLVVKQKVENFEAFTGLETKNRYTVSTPDGEPLLYAYEESSFLSRILLKKKRPLSIHVVDPNNQPVLTASRRFFWFLSHLHVQDGNGRVVGSLHRRLDASLFLGILAIFIGPFLPLTRRFTVEDSAGTALAEIQGPLIRPNTFMVYKQEEIGRVTKQWSGIGKEMFTDADTFHIQIDTNKVDQDFALLMLASALAIDLDFFEK